MMKFPTAFTILFGLIVVVAALTWIIPAGQYERAMNETLGKEAPVPGTYAQVEPNPQGLGAVLMAPIAGLYDPETGMANAVDVAVFVLVIGGFLAVVTKTGAIDAGIGWLLTALKGREILDDPDPDGRLRRRRHELRHGGGEPRLLRDRAAGVHPGWLRCRDRRRGHHARLRASARSARPSTPSPPSSARTPPGCPLPTACCCAS